MPMTTDQKVGGSNPSERTTSSLGPYVALDVAVDLVVAPLPDVLEPQSLVIALLCAQSAT
jgi:hypothetical protein